MGCGCENNLTLGCIACFRAQHNGLQQVRSMLRTRDAEVDVSDIDSPEGRLKALREQLIACEADDDNRVVLHHYKQPQTITGESDYDREQRAAKCLNRIDLWYWADDTPISARTIQFHYWGILYNHLQMRGTEEATTFCSDPQLLVVTPGDASAAFLASVMREVVKDMQELGRLCDDGELCLSDGTKMTWRLRICKADSPMLATLFGKSSSGRAYRKCACCSAISYTYRDLTISHECELDTLQDIDEFAMKASKVAGFHGHFDPRTARKSQNAALLRAFGENVG